MTFRPARVLGLLLGVLMFPALLFGASVLDFPRLSFLADNITGIAIGNTGSEPAEVSLTAYSQDGSVLATAQVVIPGGQQISEVASTLFGADAPTADIAWVRAASDSDDLTGFFLFLNSGVTEFDGADVPKRAQSIVFNLIRLDQGLRTELNIVNPNSVPITVVLRLIGPETPGEAQIMLPARGVQRVEVADLFGVSTVPEGAYVTADSSEDILGFEVVGTEDEDLLGLNARVSQEFLNTLYFPQMTVRGGVQSTFGVVNYDTDPVIVTLSAHRPDGSLFTDNTQQNPVTVGLGAGESLEANVEEFFGFGGTDTLVGWLEVTSTSEAVNGYLAYAVTGLGAAAAVAPEAQGALNAVFSHMATTLGFFTGIAVLNPTSFPVNVRIVAAASDGSTLGSFFTVLRPGERIANLISELIPRAANQAGGLINVRASYPVFMTALFGTDNGSVLANIPPQDAVASFDPAPEIPNPQVSPPIAVVPPGGPQQFAVVGATGDFDWQVNGISGGDSTLGTITSEGVYTAPLLVPNPIPITVSAETLDFSVAGSVDILALNDFISNVGTIQSVAFLAGLERLYASELLALGAENGQVRVRTTPAQELVSGIFELEEPDQETNVATFGGEDIPKIIPYTSSTGVEFLLMAGRQTGRVLALNPLTGDFVTVEDGLDQPTALVLDPVSENLLVAEADQITSIPASELAGAVAPIAAVDSVRGRPEVDAAVLTPVAGAGGLAVDECSADVFFSDTEAGVIRRWDRENGEVTEELTGLAEPTQLLGVYRRGVSCDLSFHLLIVERGASLVSLFVPADGTLIRPWAASEGLTDVAFIGGGTPFLDDDSILLAGSVDGVGNVFLVPVPDLYRRGPINPPLTRTSNGNSEEPGPDLAISSTNGVQGGRATVNVFFRPGPDDGMAGEGSDEISAVVLSMDYDETRLELDPSDANEDGIPDAILPSVPGNYDVTVFFDPEDVDGEIDVVIADLSGPLTPLSEGNLLSVTFSVLSDALGTANVRFSMTPLASIADLIAQGHGLDETGGGNVNVNP